MQMLPDLGPAAQRRHICLWSGLIDKNQTCGVNPLLIFSPPLPMMCDLWPELLARQNAFFETEPLLVNKTPDLNLVHLHAKFCGQLSDKPAECEVAGSPCNQPVAQSTSL